MDRTIFKIIYTCSDDHLGYEFPKRKWWDFRKKARTEEILLADIFPGENVGVLVRIAEDGPAGYSVQMQERCMRYVRRIFLEQILKEGFEAILIVDSFGDTFSDVISDYARDANYLSVATQCPWKYDDAMERIEDETGLIGMVYEDYRDFNRYQGMFCEGRRTLVLLGESEVHYSDLQYSETQFGEKSRQWMRYRFPKNSLFADFTMGEEYRNCLLGKRRESDYTSIPLFLDNMVKNRYNAVVNEGLHRL